MPIEGGPQSPNYSIEMFRTMLESANEIGDDENDTLREILSKIIKLELRKEQFTQIANALSENGNRSPNELTNKEQRFEKLKLCLIVIATFDQLKDYLLRKLEYKHWIKKLPDGNYIVVSSIETLPNISEHTSQD